MSSFHLCKTCLLPSTKPDLRFNDAGVCSACQRFSRRDSVDWEKRRQQLVDIISNIKRTNKSEWDCVIPVSGGKDSTVQALTARELGLNCLLVTSTTCDLTSIGRKNINNLINLGFDHIQVSPRKDVRWKLNRFGLEQVGDISWPEHVALFTIPIKVAVAHKIPLVIWGENSQDEYGAGSDEAAKSDTLDRQWLEEFGGLNGLRVSDVQSMLDLSDDQIRPYTYPSTDSLEEVGIRSLFLGSYLPWSGIDNALTAQAFGLTTYGKPVEGSIVDYENLDNHQNGIHDYFKYLKFGFSRATDIASVLIRRKLISRNNGLLLVSKHERQCFPSFHLGKSLDQILEPLNMTIDDFVEICDLHTNREIFETDSNSKLVKEADGTPRLKSEILNNYVI